MTDIDTRILQLIAQGKALLSEYRESDWENKAKTAEKVRSFFRRLREIGHNLFRKGRLQDCLSLYTLAQELILAIGDEGTEREGAVLMDIGEVYTVLGQHTEARACLQRSLEILEEEGAQLGVAIALSHLGTLYHKMQRYQQALDCFDGALTLVPALGGCWINQGGVLEAMGRREEAIASYHRALKIRRWHKAAWEALQRLDVDVDNESQIDHNYSDESEKDSINP